VDGAGGRGVECFWEQGEVRGMEETSKKLKNKEKTTKGKGTVPVQVHAVSVIEHPRRKTKQKKKRFAF
jgi:hypothetical protein